MKGFKRYSICLVVLILLCSVMGICYGGGTVAKIGSKSNKVTEIQAMLTELKIHRGEIDGQFGKQTLAAVKTFQKRSHRSQTGIVDKKLFDLMCKKSGLNFNNYRKVWVMEASAYSPHDPGVNHRTATGVPLRRGVIAVDPMIIPLGTRVYIMGYGFGTAADTGGAIKGNVIDVAFSSRGEALRWGRKYVRVYFF